jgi:hypothetical protein
VGKQRAYGRSTRVSNEGLGEITHPWRCCRLRVCETASNRALQTFAVNKRRLGQIAHLAVASSKCVSAKTNSFSAAGST